MDTRSPGTAFGIAFIDYHRGDGPGVGPGEQREWRPVLIEDGTPWVRDYRGLWGLDTGDPFGGERAPAGPRYERGGSVRLCWSDPVGWAGLDKEAPSPRAEQQAVKGLLRTPLTSGNEFPHAKIGGVSGANRLVEAAWQERHVN